MRTTNRMPAGLRRTVAATLALTLELSGGAWTPLWAQRRRAEPEASPQFQSSDAGSAVPGGPISEPGGGPPEGPGDLSPRAPQDLQIGASAPERSAPPAPTNPLDTRVVVRVKNAPLSTFLDTISAQARVNFIITEGLESKRITAFLQSVTVREALQVLLEIKGLTYQRIGRSNTYVVSPRAKGLPNRITRIYQLNYIPMVPLSTDNQQQNQTGAVAQLSQLQGADATQLAGAQGQGGGASDTLSRTAVPILSVIKSVLSTRYGALGVDARTNSIIVTDIPEVFPQVEQILAELDRKAPQVMIEAQIVEINSDRAQQLGLEWGGTNGELAAFNGPARDTSFPLNFPKNSNNFKFFDPVQNVVSQLKTTGGGGDEGGGGGGGGGGGAALFGNTFINGFIDLTQLRVVLRALVSRAEARFLGKPKILTVNNNPARIQVSRDAALSQKQTQSSVGTGSLASQTVEPERESIGLTLSVTPQVNKEGYITLLVQPSFADVIESNVSSRESPVFDPVKRAASTLVRVKSGQTLVMGGLLESRETKSVRKVPVLGYIPLLGWLFTSSSSQRRNTDLVIFITPTVVSD